MSRLFPKLILVVGVGMTGAACQGDGYGTPSGYYQQPQQGYYQQPSQGYYQPAPAYYQPAPAYYAPAPSRYGYAQPTSNYNSTDGRRYTSVTVTNRGQNGNRDDVVQQQVVCGSQYYDGYRTRTAPRC
jgi:hypothetical protein